MSELGDHLGKVGTDHTQDLPDDNLGFNFGVLSDDERYKSYAGGPIGKLYFIPMEFNTKRVNALVDNGEEMTSLKKEFFDRLFSGTEIRPMGRSLHVAVENETYVSCHKAILRIRVLGHEVERVVALVEGLSHTAVLGNDVLELCHIYAKTYSDPPMAFSDMKGTQQKLLVKDSNNGVARLNSASSVSESAVTIESVKGLLQHKEFEGTFHGLKVANTEPVTLRLKRDAQHYSRDCPLLQNNDIG